MLTKSLDLLSLVQQDTFLKRTSSHRGGEYHGPCPFCGGTDRFRVQPEENFWKCRQCERSGDCIAYLVDSGRITKKEAHEMRHKDDVIMPPRKQPPPTVPPGQKWQTHGKEFVAQCQTNIWNNIGARARAWLVDRGLTEQTIRDAGLGYNLSEGYEKREIWGLQPAFRDNGKPKSVWLPRGIVIPWFIGADLWRINSRRPVGDPKYIGPAGFSNALYNVDAVQSTKPALLVEGEFDVLTVRQQVGDIITPVATGSTEGSRRPRWIAKLATCPLVLVTFDADEAGEAARRYWLRMLSNGRYWRPFWADINKMQQDGVDLRGWVLAGLGNNL